MNWMNPNWMNPKPNRYNAMDVKQFGSALDTQRFTSSLNGVLSLRTIKSSDKTFRPNFLMLASLPTKHSAAGSARGSVANAEEAKRFETSGTFSFMYRYILRDMLTI